MTNETQGALSHIKVLDLSRVSAGPWCTQMLADLGADVIKVERPGGGRRHAPLGPARSCRTQTATTLQQASYFAACNRNKRSITIDMSKPEGQALIRQTLALQSDIAGGELQSRWSCSHYGLDYAEPEGAQPQTHLIALSPASGRTAPTPSARATT